MTDTRNPGTSKPNTPPTPATPAPGSNPGGTDTNKTGGGVQTPGGTQSPGSDQSSGQ